MQSITRAPTVRRKEIGLMENPSIIKSSYPNSTASSFLIGRNAYQEAKTKKKNPNAFIRGRYSSFLMEGKKRSETVFISLFNKYSL